MVGIAFTEVCLEINKDVEDQLLVLDQYYLDGLITQDEMAAKASLIIMEYLQLNEMVLVKIIKPSN